MEQAFRLGMRGQGATGSNPAVGCVIVKDGRVIAQAATAPGGRPHAEEQAVPAAGPDVEGATVYVTLEP
ncbi:MAG: cytidine deaminase, partial [Pseudomonadota bacterium]|nr:cytidine deaminase [Pseudomonadota bacterium]